MNDDQPVEHRLSRAEGDFRVIVLTDGTLNPPSAAIFGEPTDDCLVRVQSRCVYGEIYGSVNCRCRAQLDRTLELIEADGAGVIVYLDQDVRSFEAAGALLSHLELSRVRLLTNNQAKVVGLEKVGIVVKQEKLPIDDEGGVGSMADYPVVTESHGQIVEHHLSRSHGDFRVMVLADGTQNPASAAVFGVPGDDCLVRIQSRCVYGEIFGSVNCDCRAQLDRSIELIEAAGSGVIVYLDQEGRGAGLHKKARGYHISQTLGLDTFASYRHLGLDPDTRSFGDAATLLHHLRLNRVRLLTNNPAKVDGLRQAEIQVHREMLLDDIPSEYALAYLIAKEEHGHQFRQGPIAVDAAGL